MQEKKNDYVIRKDVEKEKSVEKKNVKNAQDVTMNVQNVFQGLEEKMEDLEKTVKTEKMERTAKMEKMETTEKMARTE